MDRRGVCVSKGRIVWELDVVSMEDVLKVLVIGVKVDGGIVKGYSSFCVVGMNLEYGW